MAAIRYWAEWAKFELLTAGLRSWVGEREDGCIWVLWKARTSATRIPVIYDAVSLHLVKPRNRRVRRVSATFSQSKSPP